jgi:hypothetical protein
LDVELEDLRRQRRREKSRDHSMEDDESRHSNENDELQNDRKGDDSAYTENSPEHGYNESDGEAAAFRKQTLQTIAADMSYDQKRGAKGLPVASSSVIRMDSKAKAISPLAYTTSAAKVNQRKTAASTSCSSTPMTKPSTAASKIQAPDILATPLEILPDSLKYDIHIMIRICTYKYYL